MVTFNQLGRYGRLGNQMFQIAGTIGIAEANGYQYYFPEWKNYDAKDRFNTKENIDVQKHFANRLPTAYLELKDYHIPWGWHGIQHPDNANYVGHLQSELYFKHCADKIRHYFTFTKPHPKNDYTAIHVRMGDYGDGYHPICSREYYEAAMSHLAGPYILFSDEPMRAYEYLGKPKNVTLYVSDTYDELAKMASCKNHIIANSTFSWWGAWLAGGQVVAPRRWFGPDAGIDALDIYCENWVVI